MKKDAKNRLLVLGIGLIVIGGIAFGLSNTNFLKGAFPSDLESELQDYTLSETVNVSTNNDLNEYYAALAEAYANQAQEFADDGQDCVDDLEQYYGWDITLDCSDTDGGIDYDTQGSIDGVSWYSGDEVSNGEEYCLDADTLVEYWCIDDASSLFDNMVAGDTYDCGEGYSCSDGACIEDKEEPDPECTIDSDCSDGYSCSNSNVCEEDPSVPYACEDEDEGIDYFTQSDVSGTSYVDGSKVSNEEEYCDDNGDLVEYWCPETGAYADYLYSESFECPDDYICDDGACIDIDDVLTSKDYECDEPFTDTNDEMICRAYKAGIVKGKSYSKFDPFAGITRAEVIKIIILTMGEEPLESDQGIRDMDESHWAWGYVNRAKKLKIITESTFNPDVEVTRGTTMVWLVRAAEETLDKDEWEDRIPWSDMTDDNPVTYAAVIANDTIVEFLDEGDTPVAEGYSDDTFRPENSILRYEAVYLAYRSYLAWFSDEESFVDPDE